MDISKSIVIALYDNNMNRSDLAAAMGVSRAAISSLMKRQACTINTLKNIADAFDMPVSKFIALGE